MRSKSFRRKNRKMSRKRGGQQYRNYVQSQYGTPLNNYAANSAFGAAQDQANFDANSVETGQTLASIPSAPPGYVVYPPPPFPLNRSPSLVESGLPYGGRTRKGRKGGKGRKSRKGGKRRSY